MTDPAETDPRRLLADLQGIMAVSRAIGTERDLSRLLTTIAEAASKLLACDRTSVFLLDRERNELCTSVAQGTNTIRIPVGKGIAGSVASSGETVNIVHAYADERFNPEIDRRTGYTTQNMLCMPLRNHTGAVVGVVQCINSLSGQPFSAYEEQVLATLGAQAGVAVDNAQLVARDLVNQRMQHDMELARQIQRGLLPDLPQDVPGWRFATWCRTCDETGGDYYDFIPNPDGGVDAVVGDVSGHGIGAALFMSTARAFVRALHAGDGGDSDGSDGSGGSGEHNPPDPGRLLTRLNRLLAQDMGDDAFMTMALCRLGPDGACRFVSAGHEPPLIWRKGKGFSTGGDTGLLLGMIEDSTYHASVLPRLETGDLLVLLTDGISEAHVRDNEFLGLDRLRELIAGAAAGGADAVCAAIVTAVEAHLCGTAPHDDMTLVVAERR